MFSKLRKNNKGFTIIEVLIVLAIAGLIMLIVFLAVPALQRNQRNNARNTEATRISAAVTECLANRNSLVASCLDDAQWNVGTLQQLTTADATQAAAPTADSPAGSTSAAAVTFNEVCLQDGTADSNVANSATSRDFVVQYVLEPAVTRCIGSSS